MPRTPIEDLSVYADKEATPAQEHFTDWIVEKVGITFATQKEMVAFREGVRLAKALVMRHQASDENKEFTASQKASRAAAVAAAPAKAPKAPKAAPAAAVEEEEEAPAPKPAKAARGRRGRAAAGSADAPF